MLSINHILFPVDFSERCDAILPFVSSMARRFQSRLTLLHVAEAASEAMHAVESHCATSFGINTAVRSAEERLAGYMQSETGIDKVLEHGDPAFAITRFAHRHGVDLIMMPTHGYGILRKALLGSVTAKVLHDVDCHVWTAAHIGAEMMESTHEYRRILCALDLIPQSAELIQFAATFAKEYQAQLRLVHATPKCNICADSPRHAEFHQNLIEWARERVAVLQRDARTNLPACIESGRPAQVVRAAALHYGSDLIVIGRSAHEPEGIRSNAYSIICESPCPVLSLRESRLRS